jgi:hypothetical protein
MNKENQVSKKQKITKESNVTNSHGKTVEELKEIVQSLQAQLTENQRLAVHHQTMATKAQGALEVMLQMIPKQEVEEMIREEKENENHQKTTENNNNQYAHESC